VANGPSDELAGVIAGLILGEEAISASYIAKWKARPTERLGQPGSTLMTRDTVEDRLGEITAPALIVHGTADAAISMDKAEQLRDGLPNAELLVVDGGTHAANMTHPEVVNPAIAAFLAALPA
jgi:pimeloyl-ACP methyl ester carboxylesterase